MKEYKNKLSLIAFDLSECADVMPNTLNKHKSAVYNACLDMIHHFEPILKEVHNNALKMVEESLPKQYPLMITKDEMMFEDGYNSCSYTNQQEQCIFHYMHHVNTLVDLH